MNSSSRGQHGVSRKDFTLGAKCGRRFKPCSSPVTGLFSDTHVPFEVDRVNSPAGSPSLTQMATKAVKFLQKNDNGFFLLVRRCSRQWGSN